MKKSSHQPLDQPQPDQLRSRQENEVLAAEIKELKEKLRKATEDVKCRDQLLAVLCHEIRNPIAAISLSLDGLQQAESLSENAIKLIDITHRQITQVSRLLECMLSVSDLRFNRTAKVVHDLNASIEEVIHCIQPTIDQKHQTLHLQLSNQPLWIRGDTVRLKQAMSNLLDNAAKYTPENGQIWMQTGSQENQIIFTVRDSGQGIEEATLGQIFDLFFQVTPSLQHQPGSYGIGLFLVDQIVRAHEGSVSVHSEGSGRGSQFTMTFPATLPMAE